VICLGIFVSALDQTVIYGALPGMMVDINLPVTKLDQASWIVIGYLLGYTFAMPVMGRVSDVFGHGRIYILSLIILIFGCQLPNSGYGSDRARTDSEIGRNVVDLEKKVTDLTTEVSQLHEKVRKLETELANKDASTPLDTNKTVKVTETASETTTVSSSETSGTKEEKKTKTSSPMTSSSSAALNCPGRQGIVRSKSSGCRKSPGVLFIFV
jgi:hypothetical protein